MAPEASALRDQLLDARTDTHSHGRGYPADLRARVVAFARGRSLSRVADALDLSPATVRAWVDADSAFVPVAFAAPDDARPDERRFVLVSPAGWRVEVDLDALRTLLGTTS